MISELVAKISVDVSDLNKAGLKVKDFEEELKGAFKRVSGEARPHAALEQFVEELSSGNVLGAIEAIGSRLSFLGIAGGVAFGLLVKGATEAQKSVEETNKAFKALEEVTIVGPTAGAGVDEVKGHIDSLLKSIDEVGPRLRHGRQFFEEFWESVKRGPMQIATTGLGAEAETRQAKQQRILKDAYAELGSELQQQAFTERAAAEAAREHLVGSEALSDQQKIEAATAVEVAKAQHEALLQKREVRAANLPEGQRNEELEQIRATRTARIEAANFVGQTQRMEAATNAQIKAIELQKEWDIYSVKKAQLTGEAEQQAAAAANIKALEAQRALDSSISEEKKKQLDYEIAMARLTEEQRKKEAGVKQYKDIFEQSRYTAQELAQMPRRGWIGGEMDVSIVQAREALRLEDMAAKEKAAGHPMEAFGLLARAQQFRAEIPLLKESEKNPAFAFVTAINEASVFKGMLGYLENIAKGVANPNNPFLNR